MSPLQHNDFDVPKPGIASSIISYTKKCLANSSFDTYCHSKSREFQPKYMKEYVRNT